MTAPQVRLQISGRDFTVAQGTTVAAALALAGVSATRNSISGEPRAAVCGMGICQECRVQVNDRVRVGCQTLCADGMVVEPMA
jgi:predicted molibdopterin-dependent oxidoreductase YjgC